MGEGSVGGLGKSLQGIPLLLGLSGGWSWIFHLLKAVLSCLPPAGNARSQESREAHLRWPFLDQHTWGKEERGRRKVKEEGGIRDKGREGGGLKHGSLEEYTHFYAHNHKYIYTRTHSGTRVCM